MERQNNLDTVAGIAILVVMAMHYSLFTGTANPESGNTICHFTFFFNFFMPFFYFKAGMFKKENANFLTTLKKKTKRLMIPFLMFSLLALLMNDQSLHKLLFYDSIHNFATQMFYRGATDCNNSLWFLFGLYITSLIGALIDNKKVLLIIGTLGLIIGFALHIYNINQFWLISYLCTGTFMYIVGYLLRDIQYQMGVAKLCLVLFLIIMFYCPSSVDMHTNLLEGGFYLLWPICAISGIVTANNLFRRIHCSGIGLNYIGKISMAIYLLHIPIAQIFTPIILNYFTPIQSYYIMFTIGIVMIFVVFEGMKRLRLQWIFGE